MRDEDATSHSFHNKEVAFESQSRQPIKPDILKLKMSNPKTLQVSLKKQ